MSAHLVTVELSDETYDTLRHMVDSGEYGSESEAIGLLLEDVQLPAAPVAGDPAFERWMQEDVFAADDELEADPESGLAPEQLQAHLDAARMSRAQAR